MMSETMLDRRTLLKNFVVLAGMFPSAGPLQVRTAHHPLGLVDQTVLPFVLSSSLDKEALVIAKGDLLVPQQIFALKGKSYMALLGPANAVLFAELMRFERGVSVFERTLTGNLTQRVNGCRIGNSARLFVVAA